MRGGVAFASLALLAGCGAEIYRTDGGVRYVAAFEYGVHTQFTPFEDSATGEAIDPFPIMYDGVTVRRVDGAEVTEADRASAQALAAQFCARDDLVPSQPGGTTFPAMTEWFFGTCVLDAGG